MGKLVHTALVKYGEDMSTLNIFVSFEFDKDNDLKNNFYSQAKNCTNHKIRNCSLNESYPDEVWKNKAREAIVNRRMDSEEQDILDRFERGELRPSPDAANEIAVARQAARNTFNKTRRVNLRVTERDFMLAHSRAREEGVPYQTLLSSVIHKYLSGRLTEKR